VNDLQCMRSNWSSSRGLPCQEEIHRRTRDKVYSQSGWRCAVWPEFPVHSTIIAWHSGPPKRKISEDLWRECFYHGPLTNYWLYMNCEQLEKRRKCRMDGGGIRFRLLSVPNAKPRKCTHWPHVVRKFQTWSNAGTNKDLTILFIRLSLWDWLAYLSVC
jgi:hypothetical protein